MAPFGESDLAKAGQRQPPDRRKAAGWFLGAQPFARREGQLGQEGQGRAPGIGILDDGPVFECQGRIPDARVRPHFSLFARPEGLDGGGGGNLDVVGEAVGIFNRRVEGAVEVDVTRLPIGDELQPIVELVLADLREH
jgi:hypothetical protein